MPRAVLGLLVAGLLAQPVFRESSGAYAAGARALPHPPARPILHLAAGGESSVLARLLMLWLLTFERHNGTGVPLASLDYGALRAWLGRILELDPGYDAPLRAAARGYAGVSSAEKKRTMLDFVHEQFPEDPARRWPWLAFAALEARHRMGDLPLALRYARTLGEHAAGAGIPGWARDMRVVILEDLGEPSAAAVVRHRIESGRISNPVEPRSPTSELGTLEGRERGVRQARASDRVRPAGSRPVVFPERRAGTDVAPARIDSGADGPPRGS